MEANGSKWEQKGSKWVRSKRGAKEAEDDKRGRWGRLGGEAGDLMD